MPQATRICETSLIWGDFKESSREALITNVALWSKEVDPRWLPPTSIFANAPLQILCHKQALLKRLPLSTTTEAGVTPPHLTSAHQPGPWILDKEDSASHVPQEYCLDRLCSLIEDTEQVFRYFHEKAVRNSLHMGFENCAP